MGGGGGELKGLAQAGTEGMSLGEAGRRSAESGRLVLDSFCFEERRRAGLTGGGIMGSTDSVTTSATVLLFMDVSPYKSDETLTGVFEGVTFTEAGAKDRLSDAYETEETASSSSAWITTAYSSSKPSSSTYGVVVCISSDECLLLLLLDATSRLGMADLL